MYIDFSCKRDIYLQDEFGDIQSMAEPYFRKEQIAPGTWLIRSDGDFSYLVEGESEAVLMNGFHSRALSRSVASVANSLLQVMEERGKSIRKRTYTRIHRRSFESHRQRLPAADFE